MTDTIPSGEVVYNSLPDGTDATVGATSQAIVQATGLSKSTVNARLKELVEAGRVIAFDGEGAARLYRQAFAGEENQDPPLYRTIGLDEVLSDDGPEGLDVDHDGGALADVPEPRTPTDDERDEADAEYADVETSDDGEGDDAEAPQTSPETTEWPGVAEVPEAPASSSLADVAEFMDAVRPVSAPPADDDGEKTKRGRKPREASDHQWTVYPPGGLQNAILSLLQANPDKEWRASEVGKALNAQAGSVTFALQTLAKKGNVVRTENPPRWRAA